MTESHEMQHWIVSVVREAALPGAESLEIPPSADPAAAWRRVGVATGIDADGLADLVAAHFGLDRADLTTPELIATRLVPAAMARQCGVLVLHCTDRIVTVATSDPFSFEIERAIQGLTARSVVFEIAPPHEVTHALDRAYAGTPLRTAQVRREADRPARILVVDDDPDARIFLRSILTAHGLEVTEAADGSDALEILGSSRIDLVTLDLRMPGIDGFEVLGRVRARIDVGLLPVIVATGVDDPETELALLKAGADDFVVKPVDPARFILRVEAVLRRYRVAHGLT